MLINVAALIILVALAGGSDEVDYCKMCPSGQHVACNNDGSFSEACPDNVKLVNMNKELKDFILTSHNTKRNEIANGDIPNYESATRMATMKWCPELEKMAQLNAIQCRYEHDDCLSTAAFPYAGQNLAYYEYNGDEDRNTDLDIIKHSIDDWWSEHHDPDADTKGHFTVMARDKNVATGCAAVRYTKDDENHILLFTCNYATTNIVGADVYETGPVASKCETGTNPEFPHLCSLSEVYDLSE